MRLSEVVPFLVSRQGGEKTYSSSRSVPRGLAKAALLADIHPVAVEHPTLRLD
jgi:hypothetical protein